jgi:hypothetical protein
MDSKQTLINTVQYSVIKLNLKLMVLCSLTPCIVPDFKRNLLLPSFGGRNQVQVDADVCCSTTEETK